MRKQKGFLLFQRELKLRRRTGIEQVIVSEEGIISPFKVKWITRNYQPLLALILMVALMVTTCNFDTYRIATLDDTVLSDNNAKKADSAKEATNKATSTNADVITWLAGMVADVDKIHSNIKEILMTLNCDHRVGIHIVVKLSHQVQSFQRELQVIQSEALIAHSSSCWHLHEMLQDNEVHEECYCAPIVVQSQDDLQSGSTKTLPLNRIDRIATIRDSQRYALHKIYTSHRQRIQLGRNTDKGKNSGKMRYVSKPGIIILADLDLFLLPQASIIIEQVNLLQNMSYPFDALCAAGITMNLGKNPNSPQTMIQHGGQEPWYYDTFSTVFLPDTFSHPIKRRLVPHLYKGEDPQLVRSNDQLGNFTQGDIYRYFHARGQKKSISNTMVQAEIATDASDGIGCTRVKSCFGGMTLYRATSYFEQYCTYQLQANVKNQLEHWNDNVNDNVDNIENNIRYGRSKSIARYANNKEKRPCEHVVFHDCLMKVTTGHFRIAVNPALKTFWKRDF
jgi:hypothetical protein